MLMVSACILKKPVGLKDRFRGHRIHRLFGKARGYCEVIETKLRRCQREDSKDWQRGRFWVFIDRLQFSTVYNVDPLWDYG